MKSAADSKEEAPAPKPAEVCGIVMPISGSESYPESHWKDVLDILTEAVLLAGLNANLVSYAEESGLIHTNIVQNLYDNPLVICDVSSKNPNVMFELGLRLAFDRPTIIVKDDATSYSFDTSVIEHIGYPRDLRFGKIVDFKEKLAAKIKATLEKAKADQGYSVFLKHFKRVRVVKLEDQEVNSYDFLVQELAGLRRDLGRIERPSAGETIKRRAKLPEIANVSAMEFMVSKALESTVTEAIVSDLRKLTGVKQASFKFRNGVQSIAVQFEDGAPLATKEHVQALADAVL